MYILLLCCELLCQMTHFLFLGQYTRNTHIASLFTGNSFLILILLKTVGAKHSPSQRQDTTCCITLYWKEDIMCNIPLLSENMSHTSFFLFMSCKTFYLFTAFLYSGISLPCQHPSQLGTVPHKHRAVRSPVPLFTSSVRKKKPSLLGREHHTCNFLEWHKQLTEFITTGKCKPRTAFLFNRKIISCPSPALLGPYAIYSTMSYQE
jgi:hypothetical protein